MVQQVHSFSLTVLLGPNKKFVPWRNVLCHCLFSLANVSKIRSESSHLACEFAGDLSVHHNDVPVWGRKRKITCMSSAIQPIISWWPCLCIAWHFYLAEITLTHSLEFLVWGWSCVVHHSCLVATGCWLALGLLRLPCLGAMGLHAPAPALGGMEWTCTAPRLSLFPTLPHSG